MGTFQDSRLLSGIATCLPLVITWPPTEPRRCFSVSFLLNLMALLLTPCCADGLLAHARFRRIMKTLLLSTHPMTYMAVILCTQLQTTALACKAKCSKLLTLQVSSYCLLALQGSAAILRLLPVWH